MKVRLMDTEYNRQKDVVGKVGEIRYPGQVLGTLVFTEGGIWLYYFKDEEGFEEVEDGT